MFSVSAAPLSLGDSTSPVELQFQNFDTSFDLDPGLLDLAGVDSSVSSGGESTFDAPVPASGVVSVVRPDSVCLECAVPEPGTSILLSSALLFVLFVIRRASV